MTRTLILGGTGWLGRAIASAAAAGGAEVTCLARGNSGDVPAGTRWVAADRTQPDAYAEVSDTDWDEVVEISYAPELVVPGLAALADRAAHWTMVSTISVYQPVAAAGADETSAVVEPDDLSRYPDAKVNAERVSAERLGDRLSICRAGLIVGPGDGSDRFGYWAARLARGGRVLVPDTTGRFVQVIDVDDLAGWIEVGRRTGHRGVVNAVGESVPLQQTLEVMAEQTGFAGEFVTATDEELSAAGVNYWMGPRSLPLWLPANDGALMQLDGRQMRAAGGSLRGFDEVVARVVADERSRGIDRERRSGLSRDEELAALTVIETSRET